MSLFDRFKIGEFLNGNIDYYNHNMMLPVGCEYTNTVVMFHDYEAPMIFKRTTSQITKSDSDIIVDISGCNREVAIPDGVYESKLFEMGLATSTNSYNSTSLLEQYIDDAPIITFTVSGSRATINENTVVTLESGKWDIGLPDGPVNIIRALYRFPYNAITRKIE